MKTTPGFPLSLIPHARNGLAFALLMPFTLPLFAQTKAPAPTSEKPVELSIFEVSADRDVGYRSAATNAGSRTGEDLKNVPMAVSVLNAEFLQDVDATDIADAARFSTGGRSQPTGDLDQYAFQFRGFRSQYQTRNLFVWQAPTDTYNVERIDIARGPNALLFGDSEPGGVANFNTKQAHFKPADQVTFRAGSWDQYRATVDLNRAVTRDWAVRAALVYDTRKNFQHWESSERRGLYLASTYRLGAATTLRLNGELGRHERNPALSLPLDSFSAWNGSSAFTFNAATGPTGTGRLSTATGTDFWVWDPLARTFRNWRGFGQSNGSAQSPARPVQDPAIMSRGAQFTGPDKELNTDFHTVGGSAEHRFGQSLTMLASFNVQNVTEFSLTPANSVLRRDPNATLPGGAPNPFFKDYYADYQWRSVRDHNLIYDGRIDAVLGWKPAKWMSQRFYATVGARRGQNNSATNNEVRINNPVSADFNSATNAVRRRVYVSPGDTAQNTGFLGPVADTASGVTTAMMPTGGKSRVWTSLNSVGLSAAGTYWDDLFRTSLGLRYDYADNDVQTGARVAATGLIDYTVPRANLYQLKRYSPTIGGVFNPFAPLTLFGNYAKTFRADTATGRNLLGESTTVRLGEGLEGGARVELLQGRLFASASIYDITQTGQNKSVAPTVNAINAIWGDPVINAKDPTSARNATTGGTNESQTLHATGYELEVWTNLTPSWTLLAGYGNNDNKVGETDVATLGYLKTYLPQWQRLAAADPAVATSINPQLTIINDYIRDAVVGAARGRSYKHNANFFTRYTFREGPLKGLLVGGGMSYRSGSVLNSSIQNGVPINLFGSSKLEWEGLLGYSYRLGSKIRARTQLNIRNLFDKEYYDEVNFAATRYAAPRSFSLTTTLSF